MRSNYERQTAEQSDIQSKIVQGDAQLCRGNFGRAWKGIFPFKAAEELAFHSKCSLRSAAYQISGEHAPSAKSIAALVTLCCM